MKYWTIILFFSFPLHAQEKHSPSWEEWEAGQNTYQHFLQNPLDINQATAADWHQLGLLSKGQIDSFLEFKTLTGSFYSIWELQAIPLWDISTLRKIQPFITCQVPFQKWGLESTHHLWIHRIEFTLEEKKGFSPPDNRSKVRYQNSPYAELHRYKGQISPSLSMGFLLQKDAGESEINDFSSAYLQWIKPQNFLYKVIIGDFVQQWGQGLVQAGGFSLGKSYESIISTQKFHLGAIPYSSSVESGFYRGISLGLQKNAWRMECFYSHRYWDATIQKDSISQSYYTSLINTGLHRTSTEISKINQVQEWSWGNSLNWQSPQHAIGVQANMTWSRWSLPKKNGNKNYQMDDWQGNNLLNTSISSHFSWKRALWMAEFAFSNSHAFALMQGAAWAKSKAIDFSYVIRYHSAGYFSPQAQALGESSEVNNELGLFLGNQYHWSKRKRLSSYLDFFLFPAPKFQVNQSNSWGWEALSRYQLEKKSQFQLFLQAKWTSKQEDNTFLKEQLIRKHQWQLSADFKKSMNRYWDWHVRLMGTYILSPVQKDWG